MQRVAIDDVDVDGFETDVDARPLSAALGATDVSVNRYRVEPGERLSGGIHAHRDQEELFVVLEGEVTFETLGPPDGDGAREGREVTVVAGEAIRFPPGEFQSGKNAAGREAVLFALGAPADTEELRVPLACPACGHGERRPTFDDGRGAPVLSCPKCGEETVVECESCGSAAKQVQLDEAGRVVDACTNCGARTAVY